MLKMPWHAGMISPLTAETADIARRGDPFLRLGREISRCT
jgi:hypothetical protein